MIILAYISLAFVAMQVINVLINSIFMQKLGQHSYTENKMLSILIPARNEDLHISNLLSDLKKCHLKQYEIIVYDDQSTDTTAAKVAKGQKYMRNLKLISSKGLPKNWLGKNYACHQLAQAAKGDYLLFLDADVRIDASIIEAALCKMEDQSLKLLSLFPTQKLYSTGEQSTVPIMNYILLSLLPLVFVRYSPFKAHAAANGQFMLFEAKTYHQMQAHLTFKSSPVEDIAIAKYYKQKQQRIACLTGDNRLKCRMYTNYQEALEGFAKNIFMFFGNKPVLAFGFGIMAAFGFIPIMIALKAWLPYYLLAVIFIQMTYALISKYSPLKTLLLFPVHLYFLFHLMIVSLHHRKQKHTLWKDRNIYV